MKKLNVGFVWQGVSKPHIREHWRDGLYMAMKEVEKFHNVLYIEPWDSLEGLDVLLYWEAPCSEKGGNAHHYRRIKNAAGVKKILLFAGGPIEWDTTPGFDLYLVESAINEQEMEALGLPWMRAFGINADIFKPMKEEKKWDGIHHASSALWKRQPILAEALREKALIVGNEQPEDRSNFEVSRELGAVVMGEQSYEDIAKLINQSKTMVQTAEYWGGGQRATLEAMACGVPVVAMTDSPKNCEYVEESGFGIICEPSKEQIKLAVNELIARNLDPQIGVRYIQSKWTHKHYAENILKAINKVYG